jgi:putative membrane protein
MIHARHCAVALSALLFATAASAADNPTAAEVLPKLHHSNQKEIEMGKLAQKNGQSKDVKSFGQMLVNDHTAADKKVQALAKQEKVDLTTADTSAQHEMIPPGPDFDKKFATAMLDDHKKDVEEARTARDKTDDAKLKALLTGIVPTLEKHQEKAQKLVDEQK